MVTMARAAAIRALIGVGEEPTDMEGGEMVTLWIRRRCSDDERRQVLERHIQGASA